MRRFGSCNAFTLIELLIVVAIIAILAAIAIPNFLEAQVRAKISRAVSDMRALQTSLETYRIDTNKYAYVTNYYPDPYAVPGGPYQGMANGAAGLTSPISYISVIPQDAFGGSRSDADLYKTMAPDDYFYSSKEYFDSKGFPWGVSPTENGTKALYVLQSKGPDKAWARNAPLGPGTDELDMPYKWQYDATNGTLSSGNIIKSGP